MKKANFSLVLSSIVFLLCLGVVSATAQTDGWTNTNLDGKVLDISDISVPDADQAIAILSSAYKALPGQPMNTPTQEANVSARYAYYEYLINEIGAANSVVDVLPYSGTALQNIVNRFNPAEVSVSASAIYEEVKTMLDQ